MARPRRCLSLLLLTALAAFTATVSLGQNPVDLRVTAPSRMLNDKTLTLKAELFDGSGDIDWRVWHAYGTVSAVRVADQTPVPLTITYFEEHAGIPAPDSIRFYNGKGSVSFTLDRGICELPGDIEISVSVLGVTGSKIVTVLDDAPLRTLSGNISGDLHWSPADGVIHLTGNVGWNGGNLVIEPGTLIMIDPGVDFDLSSGEGIQAVGTVDDPIYFFPTTGPPGMVLPNVCATSCDATGGTRHNPEAWGQIRHTGSASSVFDYVIMVGGGNGGSEGHTRPPLLRFADSSSFELRNSVLADNPGKAVYGVGTGDYTIDRTLISRCGHGSEFTGGGGYTLRILDSWYAGVGRGPGRDRCGNDCGFDGDLINPRSPGDILIKGCILTDGGDEAIDGSTATITVEDTIIYNVRDRAYSDDGGSSHATFRNCLIFGNGGAFGGGGRKTILNSTVYGGGWFWGAGHFVHMSILWPQVPTGCGGTFTHNLLGAGDTVDCDPSNFNDNPLFTKVTAPDPNFDLQPTSPAIDAGPDGDRIGWLGFPTGEACSSDTDCDDAKPCTIDTCRSGACSNEPEVGCVPCSVDAECERDPQCAGACTSGICVYGGSCDDGLDCTSSDTCVGGFCVGEDDCPMGHECNVADVCRVVPATVIFQQGVDGYSGTQDTHIFQYNANQSYGDKQHVVWGGQSSWAPPGEGMIVGLIRFDDIFGTGPGQIPVPGNEIKSAVLQYFAYASESSDDGELREAYIDWNEQVTWNSFGAEPGPQAGDYGPILAVAPAAPPGGGNSRSTVDVTSSIRAWADDPSQNKGWVLMPRPLPDGEDPAAFRSSEYGEDTTARPRLVVSYGQETRLPDVVRQPYLQKAAPTSMTIVWKTALETNSRVSFGTSPGVFDQTVLDPFVTTDHEVTLTGLTPDTTYYYEVGSEEKFHAGGCVDHYFKTPPPIGTPANFKIWAFSDSGIHSVYQYRVRDAILDRAGSHPPDLIIHSGDVDQTTPTDERYTVHHFDVYDEVLSHTVMYPSVGNHDGYTSDSSSASGPYFDAFAMPTAGECGGVASGTESYYSFDYANAHFVVLDSDGGNLVPGSPMLTWLEADLAATEQQWLIAYWHHPPYSFGSHNSNNGYDSGGRSRNMRELFLPVLEAGGVDLVFTGHSHLLERSFLISGAYGYGTFPHLATPDFETLFADGRIIDSGDGRTNGSGAYVKSPFLGEYEGTVYMTLSSGGQTLDRAPATWHPVMYTTQRYFGSALIDIDGNELTLEWIREDGARMDHFSIFKPCVEDLDCEDSRFCNGAATCNAGNCVAGTIPCSGMLCDEGADICVGCLTDLDCDDGSFCNGAETCSVTGNCETGIDPCDPGDTCNEEQEMCEQTECVLDVDCDDENPCTDDSCNAGTCERTDRSGACDDGDTCTVDDFCNGGICAGTPLDCDDGDACTVDSCDPVTGCEYSPVVCDDGDACNGEETCDSLTGCVMGTPLDCDDSDACTTDSCDPGSGCSSTPLSCDDADACTVDSCDPAMGCEYSPVVCDDGDACNGEETCDSLTGCVMGKPLDCDDSDACTTDSCDPGSGCSNTPLSCDDADACTVDSCDPATGCEYSPVVCDDGDACNGEESCDSLTGCVMGTPLDCNDSDACTTDGCDPGSGCSSTPLSCDDADACTMDSCDPATGCEYSPVVCDDGNVCTDEICDPLEGCIYANNVGSCDDDDVCTEDDLCSEGSCSGLLIEPIEAGNVRIHEGTSLTWDDHGVGFTYDVAGGMLADLWADGGVLGAVCLEPGVGEAGYTDPRPDPPAGVGYYYIVRLRGECGPGPYGQSSSGEDRLPLNGCP